MTSKRTATTLLLLLVLAAPLAAHKKHHHEPARVGATAAAADHGVIAPASPAGPPTAAPVAREGGMRPMMHDDDDRSAMTTGERLLNWLGRLHVSIVHFPLAFFPAALFTAVVARRRPGFAKPMQFLIVAGGVTAPVAAALGWLDGGMVLHDSDPLLHIHRWLGSVIGLGGLGLAIWAGKRPEAARGTAMMFALGLITAALLVQGWYGGSMVHGTGHMNW